MYSQQYAQLGLDAGCPADQLLNFARAGISLHARQLEASAAARMCDDPKGPRFVGYGGARGGGKSHWLLTQMGADDCQRYPGLKCLLVRKVGKSNLENFDDIRRRAFGNLKHHFIPSKKTLIFENGSRIISGHFQTENEIDSYLGLEYDVIGIEEATTLTHRKHIDLTTCCRTSKKNWRPRIYSTSNPGGVGHVWYRNKFITPHLNRIETDTRFIPARVTDNLFTNPEYKYDLDTLTGWQRRAWLHGDWDIAAGQFFSTFRREVHVISKFDERCASEWFAAMDYGFSHYTVVLLACKDGDGNTFIVDEHAERSWIAQQNANAIHAMMKRHGISLSAAERAAAQAACGYHAPNGKLPKDYMPMVFPPGFRPQQLQSLARFVAGADVFSTRHDGTTIDQQYRRLGISLRQATMDRINGWAAILDLLGDPDKGITPRLFIHERCGRLIECLPNLQHDPNHPEDVLKTEPDADGAGGDDSADALRYLIATKPRVIHQINLGF